MITPTETRVAAVLSELLTIGRAIPDVRVFDGPEDSDGDVTDLLGIGVGKESVFVNEEKLPGYGDGYRETISVVCGVTAWTGGDDAGFVASRARVVEILGALRDALSADPKLNGACNRALMGREQVWTQSLEQEGWAVSVGFTIDAESLI